MLELRTGVQGVGAQDGGEGVAELVPIHARRLRQIVVGPVGKIREE